MSGENANTLQVSSTPLWLTELVKDRDRLVEQLTAFIVSPRQEALIDGILKASPNTTFDIRKVLAQIPMSMPEFFGIVREVRAGLSKFQAEEMLDVFRPQVVEAAMRGALPSEQVCEACFGSGQRSAKKSGKKADEKEDFVPCWKCTGTGRVLTQPDHERQITALKISGVLEKENPNTVVNVNNAVGGWQSSPDFRRETDKIMYASAVDVVDVKAVSSPQPLPEKAAAEAEVVQSGMSHVQERASVDPVTPPVVLAAKPVGKRKRKRGETDV